MIANQFINDFYCYISIIILREISNRIFMNTMFKLN